MFSFFFSKNKDETGMVLTIETLSETPFSQHQAFRVNE
jgi:hypothetical protein